MLGKKEQQLLDALEPLAAQNGVEIITIETLGAKKSPIIRIYIDTPAGVSFNELSAAQAWLGSALDAIDPYPGAYTLEVSSPGIDRPLRTPAHFVRAIGEDIKVKTTAPQEGSRNFKGRLSAADDVAITLTREDGTQAKIAYDQMQKANVIGKIEF